MEVATAPSRHQKHYVPIVTGTLGGCGLALIVGFLFYLFLRRRRQRSGPRGLVYQTGSKTQTYRDRSEQFGFDTHPRTVWTRSHRIRSQSRPGVLSSEYDPHQGSRYPRAECEGFKFHCYECPPSEEVSQLQDWVLRHPHLDDIAHSSRLVASGPLSNIDLETGNPWDWDSNLDLLGLDALPFANVDFETIFDPDHQNLNASTVPVNSDLKATREEEFPLDIGLELVDPVDGDLSAFLSSSRAPPFGTSDDQTNFAFDHQKSSPPNLQEPSDLVPSHKDDFHAQCINPGCSSQPEMISKSPSPPSASNTEVPDELNLRPLPTFGEPSISHAHSQAPQKPESLPLPPAPNFRCPNCPRKFSSRARLESVSFLHTSL